MSDTFDHEGEAWGSYDDYLNDGDGPMFPKTLACKNCGVGGLQWAKLVSGEWRLFNHNAEQHRCNGGDILRKLNEKRRYELLQFKS